MVIIYFANHHSSSKAMIPMGMIIITQNNHNNPFPIPFSKVKFY